jgi:hypothetical protein
LRMLRWLGPSLVNRCLAPLASFHLKMLAMGWVLTCH